MKIREKILRTSFSRRLRIAKAQLKKLMDHPVWSLYSTEQKRGFFKELIRTAGYKKIRIKERKSN